MEAVEEIKYEGRLRFEELEEPSFLWAQTQHGGHDLYTSRVGVSTGGHTPARHLILTRR